MEFAYPALTDYARRKLMARAMATLEAQQALSAYGGPLAFMLAYGGHADQAGGFIANRHYPKGDRIDFIGGSQYFYHCHRENMETEEHGHFHVFIRKAGWPKSWRLTEIPEKDRYLGNPMTHLAAIGLNRYGVPIRLFMVNRWVSKESWFEAAKMKRLLKRFDVGGMSNERPKTGDQHEAWRLLDHWVDNLLHLFAFQIQWLYDRRDEAMARYVAAAGAAENPYLNEGIEELSSLDICLESQVNWLISEEKRKADA